MIDRPRCRLLLAALLAAAPTVATAQVQRSLPPEDELAPRQMQQAPQPQRAPRPRANPAAAAPAAPEAPAAVPEPGAAPAAPKPAPVARSVNCTGTFARTSNHLKLAQAFDSKNVTFGEVAGPEGSVLNASIVFAKDPKRRLEVLWQNEAARTDTSLIVITGQSQWHAPKGLRLGLGLAALEKINGKPFKLSGFDRANGSAAVDWQGGALASLPGGCKVGIRFNPDPKAPAEAVSAAAGPEFQSNDAAMRAARPVVSEIILGY